jgi:hypothetical protein
VAVLLHGVTYTISIDTPHARATITRAKLEEREKAERPWGSYLEPKRYSAHGMVDVA